MTALADAVLAVAVAGAAAGPVAVLGEGPVADEVRTAVGDPPGIWQPQRSAAGATSGSGSRPAAVVELTGTEAGIAEALALVDDLGTVVLAGPAPDGGVALDLYADAHVRGLRIVGVDPGSAT